MPHDPWIDLFHLYPSALTTPWRESSSKSLFPEKYCSISPWTEPHTGPDAADGSERQTRKRGASRTAFPWYNRISRSCESSPSGVCRRWYIPSIGPPTNSERRTRNGVLSYPGHRD